VNRPRELRHDAALYTAYLREEERLREKGADIRRVVIEHELKREYQEWLQEHNRGRSDSDGRPDRDECEIKRWAQEHNLPYLRRIRPLPRLPYASRLVERGVPLAQVRDLLGHASILTTERYDNQKLEALQAAVERLEAGKKFEVTTEATDKVSRIFQVPTKQSFADSSDAARKILRSN